MTITFELPAEIEKGLRRQLGDLNQIAKEAVLVELYRQDAITVHELSEALGISRLEAESVLKKHHVVEDLPSEEEYAAALSRLKLVTGE